MVEHGEHWGRVEDKWNGDLRKIIDDNGIIYDAALDWTKDGAFIIQEPSVHFYYAPPPSRKFCAIVPNVITLKKKEKLKLRGQLIMMNSRVLHVAQFLKH